MVLYSTMMEGLLGRGKSLRKCTQTTRPPLMEFTLEKETDDHNETDTVYDWDGKVAGLLGANMSCVSFCPLSFDNPVRTLEMSPLNITNPVGSWVSNFLKKAHETPAL